MPRLADSVFSIRKLGAERVRALEALAAHKRLPLLGRREIAERYIVPGAAPVHRRTIDLFVTWGYATLEPDGAAVITKIGTLAANYWKRQRLKALFQERREAAEREDAQAAIDLLAHNKYRKPPKT